MSFINRAFLETHAGTILQMYDHDDRRIMCNGALTVCLNYLVLANHKQPFIVDNAYNCAGHVQMHSIFLNPCIKTTADMCKQFVN